MFQLVCRQIVISTNVFHKTHEYYSPGVIITVGISVVLSNVVNWLDFISKNLFPLLKAGNKFEFQALNDFV